MGVAQNETGGANRRFSSMFPLSRATHFGTGFLSPDTYETQPGHVFCVLHDPKLGAYKLPGECDALQSPGVYFLFQKRLLFRYLR